MYKYGDTPDNGGDGGGYYHRLSSENVKSVLSYNSNTDNAGSPLSLPSSGLSSGFYTDEQQEYCTEIEREKQRDKVYLDQIFERDRPVGNGKKDGNGHRDGNRKSKSNQSNNSNNDHHDKKEAKSGNDIELLIGEYIAQHHIDTLDPYNAHG